MLGGPSAERESFPCAPVLPVAKALRSLGHEVHELDPKEGPGSWVLPPGTELVVFLHALHGTYGEDGTIQAELEKNSACPYTGCGPEASHIAFDKVLTKKCCLEAGVPTARFAIFESNKASWPVRLEDHPVVLKPVRQGSSVPACKSWIGWKIGVNR